MAEKLDMKSMDITQGNIEKIRALFPSAVTEVMGEDGKVKLAIDFDALKQELSDDLISEKAERYQMTWPDKSKAKVLANSRITATLRPDVEKSVDFDTTENLYIEGDNLDVLKLLRETYLGKVKMIYIDPPYNTGNDFVYEDDFAMSAEDYAEVSGQYDEQGNRLVKNLDSNGRFHTDWLNMIYPRLKVARDLLTENGVLLISIDDNEIDNMRKLCSEIFGESNFVTCFIWNCSTAGGIRPKFASKTHEYILCYAKNIEQLPMLFAPLSEDAKRMYTQHDDKGTYRDKDFVFKNKSTNINQKYVIECPDGEKVHPKEGYIYRFVRERFNEALAEGLVTFKKTNTGPLLNENNEQAHWNIYIKKYLGDAMGAPSTLIPKEMMSIYNVGTQCVQSLFNEVRVFENVKPVDVLTYLIKMMAEQDSIVLDFFSGSATTAHAVMQLNVEDGGNRKFIMVQLPEKCDEKSEAYQAGYKTICDIGEERIRRAGKKIKSEVLSVKSGVEGQMSLDSTLQTPHSKLDVGFRVLKLDSSNMQDVYYNPVAMTQDLLASTVDNVKADRTPLDLLFQVMLDLGVELSAKIEEHTVSGKTYYTVNGNDIIACFDDNIDNDVIVAIAKQNPLYAVFKDKSFATDSVGINNEQLFKTYSPSTVVKVI